MNLHQLSITSRLIASGAIILFLLTITMIISINLASNIQEKFFLMFDDRYTKLELIDSIDDHTSKVAEQFMEIILSKNLSRIDSLFKNIHDERNMILKELTDLSQITITERGQKLLDNLRNGYNRCEPLEKRLLAAINENRLNQEYQVLFQDIKQQHLQCEKDLTQLLEFQRTRMQEIILEIDNTKYRNMLVVITLSLLVFIITSALIAWIIVTINKPIREISIFLNSVSQGRIPAPLTESWEGEFDNIRKDINSMTKAIQALYLIDEKTKSNI